MTHKLPRPWRIALDWVLTIAGRRPHRPRDQGLGGQSVPDPVVLDGTDAPLRALGRPGERMRGAFLRPRAREPLHLPLARPEPGRDRRLQHAAQGAARVRRGRNVRQTADRASGREDPREVRHVLHQRETARRLRLHQAGPPRRPERLLDRSEELLLLRRRQPDAIVRLEEVGARSAREPDRACLRHLLAPEPAPCRHPGASGGGHPGDPLRDRGSSSPCWRSGGGAFASISPRPGGRRAIFLP